MSLMHPRVALNHAQLGHYPTDFASIERIATFLEASKGNVRFLDPCCGDGSSFQHLVQQVDCDKMETYGVEYDEDRANTAKGVLDKCLHSDVMDTVISSQTFGCLFLNPPYGILPKGEYESIGFESKGAPRLEKFFYRRTFSLLQYDGILILLIPYTSLDEEFASWLSRHFVDIRIFKAVDKQYRQVVIFGRRIRGKDQDTEQSKTVRHLLVDIGNGVREPQELPMTWEYEPYVIPAAYGSVKDFFRVSMEPMQFEAETNSLKGLWPDFMAHLGAAHSAIRAPLTSPSPWHLCLLLAGGAISGPILSEKAGRALVVRGSTHKEQKSKVEMSEDEDGNIVQTITKLDVFVPIIKAWDMSVDSPTFGYVLTISSGHSHKERNSRPQLEKGSFDLGHIVMTAHVNEHHVSGTLKIHDYLNRFHSCDWGEMSDEDKALNEHVLKAGIIETGGRLFASYKLPEMLDGQSKIWIITNVAEYDEQNRPVIVTTVLFPSDY